MRKVNRKSHNRTLKSGKIVPVSDHKMRVQAVRTMRSAVRVKNDLRSSPRVKAQARKTIKESEAVLRKVEQPKERELEWNVMTNIGRAKYVLNSYTGKRHDDGSKFFDIATFKNKKDLNEAIKELQVEAGIRK